MSSSANSMSKSLLSNLRDAMTAEFVAFENKEQSPAAQIHKNAQGNNLDAIKAIGKSGDLQTILTSERAQLINELTRYGNSAGMKSSLGAALRDLDQAHKHVHLAKNPEQYAAVDQLFQRPKNRRRGLPYDEARQFFNAHNTRLLNQDRSRLSETEKKILNARRANMRTAEKAYVKLQQQALGHDKQQTHKRGREMEI